MITAALGALPLISQVGQGLAATLKQDLSSFLALGQGGQNVPGSATSDSAPSSQAGGPAPSPPSFPALAQTFRHDATNLLLSLQGATTSLSSASPSTIASDLIQAINPNGDGTITKAQFEAAFQNLATAGGHHGHHFGWVQGSTQFADQLFSSIDSNGDGQLTGAELTSFIGQAQQQAASRYQAAQSLVSNFETQLKGLLSPTTGASASTSV